MAWALGAVALYFWPAARTSLPVQVSGAQTDVYIATAGLAGTLLGFMIAALSILIALPEDRPLLQRIRDEGLHSEILRRFAVTTVYLALMVLVGVVGIVGDREPSSPQAADELGIAAYWIWALAGVALAASCWFARSLKALIDVVPVVVAATRRR